MIKRMVLGLAAAALVWGADITGRWRGSMPGRDGNAREVVFQLKQSGETLQGTMQGPMGNQVELYDGTVKGSDVHFRVKFAFGDREIQMAYDGRIVGPDIQLKMQREGAPRAMEITLKKDR